MKMKNKKAEQAEARKRHRESQRANRRKAVVLDRAEPSKLEKPEILIVCEGENTEPSYFKKFRLVTATVETVGEGRNTVSLVNRAKRNHQNMDIGNPAKEESTTTVYRLVEELLKYL